jgi:hypothetical protein
MSGYIRRVLQVAAQDRLQPSARFLGCAQNAIASGMIEHGAVFRIAHNHLALHILAGEVRAHVELTGIARPRNSLRGAEKLELIAELDRMTPSSEELRARRMRFTVDLDRVCLEQERR